MSLNEKGKEIYKETKRIITDAKDNEQLVLFVGAGASVASGMPLWKDAISKIEEKMQLTDAQKDTLKIPQYYFNSRGKKEYTQLMRDIFRYEETLIPSELHKKILDFQTATIVTTNYDHLIELAAESNGEFMRVISQDIDMPYRKSKRELIKMHGDFEHDNFVLKEDDFLNYSRNFRLIETYVKSLIGSKVVLFIGYSLSDPDVKHIISWVKDVLKEDFQRAYLILTKTNPNDIEKEYYRNLGVNLIYGNELVEESNITHTQQLIEVLDYFLTKEQTNKLEVLYDELKPLEELNYVYGKYIANAFQRHDIVCGEDNSIDLLYIKQESNSKPLMEAIMSMVDRGECEGEFDKEKLSTIIRVCEKSRFSQIAIKEGIQYVTKELKNVEISPLENMIFNFSYDELRNLFEKNNLKLSSDNPDLYMQQAFICAFLQEYCKAYNYLKLAAQAFYSRKSYAWYFIAEFNRKYVGKIATSVFGMSDLSVEEQKKLEIEVKFIDLDRILKTIPNNGNDTNLFLQELKNFNISYTLFYNVYEYSLKANEQAITTYSLFAGTAAYESLRTKIKDFDRYETSNYIILDRFTENKSIYDLYVRTILSSINALDITGDGPGEICGNIKADALTDFDVYVILRYMQLKDLKKYFKEYGIKKIPLCEGTQTYLTEVGKSICDESRRQRKTIFETDRFWSFLELISHTNISTELARNVMQRLILIKNEIDIRSYRDTISRFIRDIYDEKLYDDPEICRYVKQFADNLLDVVITDKAISGMMTVLLLNMLHFIDKGAIKYSDTDKIQKLVGDDQRDLLFNSYQYLSDESKKIIKDVYIEWKPQNNNGKQYYQYCEGVLATALAPNIETEKNIMQWILTEMEIGVKEEGAVVISPKPVGHVEVLKQMINLYLDNKILDVKYLRDIVSKSDDEMSKWLLDLDNFEYKNFDCSWLLLCQQGLIEIIAKNDIARKSIVNIYKEQYNALTDGIKINDIIVKNFI